MKRLLFILVALLSLALVFGCSENSNNENNSSDGTNEEANDATNEETDETELNGTGEFLASDEPIELSVHLHYASSFVFNDDWEVFKEAADLTNVTLKGTASDTATDSEEAFNLMIGSQNIPDIVHGHKDKFNEYGPEGAFLPLADLIKEHAPNIQKLLDENDEVRRYVMASDGNIYFVPFVPDGEAAKGWFIRQDWLDTLGLDVPETVDDFYDVLTAFKTQDPNGNGEEDEVPYFARAIGGLEDLMLLWGAHRTDFLADGEIKFGPLEEEYENAIDNMAKWYSEGLIDQEIFTRGGDSVNILIGSNKGGATHDWFGSTASSNDAYGDDVEGLNFLPFAPPATINDEVIEETSRATVHPHGWAISHSNENVVETIKYFDFWYSEEGRRLMNFGVEGLTYTLVDGEPIFTDEVLNSENVPNHLQEYGAQIEIGSHQDFSYEEQWMNPIAKEGVLDYIENDYFMEVIPELAYTDEEQKQINRLQPEIKTYVDETFQRWILGSSDVIEDYPSFREGLLDMGIEELLKIRNEAYQRYLSQ